MATIIYGSDLIVAQGPMLRLSRSTYPLAIFGRWRPCEARRRVNNARPEDLLLAYVRAGFVVLQGPYLSYYRGASQPLPLSTPRWTGLLSEVSSIALIKDNALEFTASERSFRMKTPTAAEAARWVRLLQVHSARRRVCSPIRATHDIKVSASTCVRLGASSTARAGFDLFARLAAGEVMQPVVCSTDLGFSESAQARVAHPRAGHDVKDTVEDQHDSLSTTSNVAAIAPAARTDSDVHLAQSVVKAVPSCQPGGFGDAFKLTHDASVHGSENGGFKPSLGVFAPTGTTTGRYLRLSSLSDVKLAPEYSISDITPAAPFPPLMDSDECHSPLASPHAPSRSTPEPDMCTRPETHPSRYAHSRSIGSDLSSAVWVFDPSSLEQVIDPPHCFDPDKRSTASVSVREDTGRHSRCSVSSVCGSHGNLKGLVGSGTRTSACSKSTASSDTHPHHVSDDFPFLRTIFSEHDSEIARRVSRQRRRGQTYSHGAAFSDSRHRAASLTKRPEIVSRKTCWSTASTTGEHSGSS